ncbi:hypothetical protein NECAME_00908 [Necator americanus]|uniref:Uncharacterized protein n=1 Tax=Necator americanus TaxID=51031 RepID=W2SNF9_NECAM|nr:hypothetical protein NECAME_00908 [Necator americanus]ETN71219.1 hypothetical protein NECAME_00908 [Necator americanus]
MPEVDASQMILSSMENLFYNCGASLEISCEENYESDDDLMENKRNKITRRKAYLEKADFFATEEAMLCEEIQRKENGVVARNKRGKFDSWNLKRIEQATSVHNLSLKTSDQPGLLTRLYIQGLGNMRHETIGCMYNQEEKTKINNPVPKQWGDPNPIPILIAPFLEDNNVNSIDLSGEVEIEGGSKRPIRQSLSNHTLSPRKKGNMLSLELTIEDITAFPFRWRDEVITQPYLEETCIMNAQPIKRTARKRNTTYNQP